MNRKIFGLSTAAVCLAAGLCAQTALLSDSRDELSVPPSEGADTCATALAEAPRRVSFSTNPFSRSTTLKVSSTSNTCTLPDLSGYDTPVLLQKRGSDYYTDFSLGDWGIYAKISADGQTWHTILNGGELPKWTKYLRIDGCKSDLQFVIVDVHTDAEWELMRSGSKPKKFLSVDINHDGKLDGYYDGSVYESTGRGYACYFIFDDNHINNLYLTSNPEVVVVMDRDGNLHSYTLPGFRPIDHMAIAHVPNSGITLYPMDADNDGVVDEFLETMSNSVYSVDPNGRIHVGTLPLVTLSSLQAGSDTDDDDEARGFVAWDYSMLSPGYVGSQMFGRDGSGGGGALSGGEFKSIDINGNGLTDHVNFNSGRVYFNLGNGKYYTDSFKGRMHFADFNGDGREDYILYDGTELTLNITLPEGGVEQKKIISGYSCTNVWTRDVDRDGDPDIVLSLESGQKFIVVLENTGNGTFRRRENVVKDINSNIIDCRDYDNDGNYDIITAANTAYRLTGYTLATAPVEFAPEKAVAFVNPADGMTYAGNYYVSNSENAQYAKLNVPANTRPVAPQKAPDIIYEPATGLLKISWTAGSDKETPAADLTYSLRVGTSAGADDILTAHASADGARYQAAEGNSSRATSRIIDASRWPAGTYYISVQTVDGNYCGSTFSPAAVMTKSEPSADFSLDYRPNLGIQTPITVRLKSQPLAGEVFSWDFDGGTEVSRSADGTEISVAFDTPGEKNISLSVASPSGVVSRTVSRALEVFPTSLHEGGITMDFSPSSNPDDTDACFSAAFDMDEDGVAEAYSGRWYSKFMKGDKDGVYRPIDRMFNSHQYVEKFRDVAVATIDLDGDGMCDIVSPDFQSRYSKLYYGYNYGDLDMEFEMAQGGGLDNLYVEQWLDFDNDGAYDVFGSSTLRRNDGTYKDFSTNTLRLNYQNTFADINGDGLIDVIMGNTVYFNKGDFSFANPRTLPGVPNSTSYRTVYAAEDFDNNGAIDYLFKSDKTKTLSILWDDYTVSDLGVTSEFDVRSNVKDINNDGYPDIYAADYIITILPGRTWKVYDREDLQKDVDGTPYNYFGRCFEGSDGKTYSISDYYQSGYYATTFPGVLQVNLRNEAPAAPANVRHTQNDRFVVLEWDHSVDAETPATQMKYNLSVKRKGASGAGAYLFSPANSGKNGVPVPSNKPLIKGNVFSIPVANIPAGEYEVKVQGVDALNKQSDFSPVYKLVVTETASIDMQSTGEVNVPVEIKILVNYTTAADFDGGRELSYASGVHTVVWDTPGVKTVKVNDFSATIQIQPAPDGSFTLPEQARRGDHIRVAGKLMNQGEWAVIKRVWEGKWTEQKINVLDDNEYFDIEILSATDAVVTPKLYSSTTLHHFVSSRFSTQQYSGTFVCPHDEFVAGVSDRADTPSAPIIDYVTADAATGKYKVQWTNPEKVRPEATGIKVYKEGAVAGKYILLDRLPLTATEYIDRTSNPDVMAARYVLTYELSYGESRDSKAHQPVHVMINRGAGSSWNLIWGKYEGASIPQYRILRGASPESLAVIAEVSGNLTSYTDFTAPASGALYYAVETVLEPETMRAPARAAAATSHPRSNVIAAAGNNITFAEKITIIADEGTSISDSNGHRGLQLRAIINPTGATFGRVNWVVTSGDDVVAVDGTGYVTPVGNGQATVRAQSIDGSGIYDEIVVTVSGYVGVNTPAADAPSTTISVYPSPAVNEVTIDGLSSGCDIYVFSVGGKIAYSRTAWDGEASATIDCSTWPAGTYVVRVQNPTDFSIATRKFLKK